MRAAVLSLCLIGFATCVWADSVSADQGDGCKKFAWDVSHEVTVMKQTPTSITAGTKPGTQVPLVKLDKPYELDLSPQSGITYSAQPMKPTLNDSARGGLVRFHTGKAGLYRVAITTGHWLDVVDGDKPIESKDFSGSRECPRPHKIVEFELPANKELMLQFSGATDPSVIASITPVATTSPN
jgi:hypothetical protein